ncbi:hypothetical protein SAMN04515671_0928 [Nakamurella panacisegetis]|uniref:Uncharacterized protein n=2 Tax=Nakamurella panacisegetis TaxID=1090615 RepID=A0A1H0JIR2_9ACTN|nr:hypothetical protein SAMN04515671_0928 [Nakamurella panacisegetis]
MTSPRHTAARVGAGVSATGRSELLLPSGPTSMRTSYGPVGTGRFPTTDPTPGAASGQAGPKWFTGGISSPIQVARVTGAVAPSAVPVRRSNDPAPSSATATATATAAIVRRSTAAPAGSATTGFAGPGARGPADPGSASGSGRSGGPGGMPGPAGAVGPDSIGGAHSSLTVKRFPARPDRIVTPSTRNLLSRPSVAPPRSAPRGLTPMTTGSPVDARSATPAPPFTLNPASAGPPVPGVAQGVGPEPSPNGAVVRRSASLVDQVPASLFERARSGLAASNPSNAPIRRVAEGNWPMAENESSESSEQKPGSIAASLTPREWDQLVDIIVERIEDRVSDELSRRGRRFTPGVM